MNYKIPQSEKCDSLLGCTYLPSFKTKEPRDSDRDISGLMHKSGGWELIYLQQGPEVTPDHVWEISRHFVLPREGEIASYGGN